MPTISVPKVVIQEGLNRPDLTDHEFEELCFEFGIELDEVTSEKQIAEKETGKVREDASSEIIYKIEIPANRYDLLCAEGLLRALRIFERHEQTPHFRCVDNIAPLKMTVAPETASIRPFVVCAVLRGVVFTERNYQSFIDLQDKLHQNICRKRTLVAIGTHDLDTLTPPFTYEALPPAQINFVPLKQTQSVDGNALMQLYEKDAHLGPYLPIIRDSPVYPVIYDSKRVVLSLPPIINGQHSRITLQTRNVFIECTATDLTKANTVLNTVVAMFSEYCAVPFTCEPVEVTMPDGKTQRYPQLEPYDIQVSSAYVNDCLGLKLSGDDMCALLQRMQLPVQPVSGAAAAPGAYDLVVKVPPTRSDVLHQCDVMEDVGIAYGYTKLPVSVPATSTVGRQQPLNKLTDLVRAEVAQAGYTELLTFSLLSRKDNEAVLPADGVTTVSNPASLDYEVVRTSLIPGVLKTVASNRGMPLPMHLFECSDVVLKDASVDVGARNERRLCALYCGTTAGFQFIHGLLDRIMMSLDIKWAKKRAADDAKSSRYYAIQADAVPGFLSTQAGRIMLDGQPIGVIGVLHPKTLAHFGLKDPVSLLELCIEPFV